MRSIYGKVELVCKGKRLLDWINQAVQAQIQLENICWVDSETIRLSVTLPHFFRLYALGRQAGIRLRIIRKEGMPFLWKRAKRRKFFFIGIPVFFAMLLVLSSFVWNIQIEGTERISTQHVQALLKREGVYPGQWKGRLPDRERVQHQLLMQLPQASWVGMRVEGTRVVVTVVEKKAVGSEKEQAPEAGPVHLVSTKNALIYDLQVERGNPLVEVNDVVKKGQILVSGIYGNQHHSETGKIVGAKGKVWGEVWYESEVVIPLERKRKVYTGARVKQEHPYLFGLVLKNPWGKKVNFRKQEKMERVYSLYVGMWALPMGYMEEEFMEVEWVEEKLDQKQAIQLGRMRATDEMLQKLGREGRILGEKVLHTRVENGKVYLKVHFDVIEDIVKKQPILQGE
ncbi:sporulation protein YqfD [Laceyella putida]|uniref:Sporulation protein YqfD n=1 Tax=Laceyella putida TaxID=110101 RepID=A0ABW2RI25_9BACL